MNALDTREAREVCRRVFGQTMELSAGSSLVQGNEVEALPEHCLWLDHGWRVIDSSKAQEELLNGLAARNVEGDAVVKAQ